MSQEGFSGSGEDSRAGAADSPRPRENLPELVRNLNPEISPVSLLGRTRKEPCPLCGKPQTWYCRACLRPLPPLNVSPVVTGVPITIVRDPREGIGRSSAPGLASLSNIRIVDREQVEIPDGAVVLMPGPSSRAVEEVDWARVSSVFVIDCTWIQVPSMLRTKLGDLPRVRIASRRTIFWRSHGQANQDCLSTAEAVYYLLRDINERDATPDRRLTTRRLDTLLSFFFGQYCQVQRELYRRHQTQVTSRKSAVPNYQHWPEVRQLLEARWGPLQDDPGELPRG